MEVKIVMRWLLLMLLLSGCAWKEETKESLISLAKSTHLLSEQLSNLIADYDKDQAYFTKRIDDLQCQIDHQDTCKEAANATYEYYRTKLSNNDCACVYIKGGQRTYIDPQYAKAIIQSNCKE